MPLNQIHPRSNNLTPAQEIRDRATGNVTLHIMATLDFIWVMRIATLICQHFPPFSHHRVSSLLPIATIIDANLNPLILVMIEDMLQIDIGFARHGSLRRFRQRGLSFVVLLRHQLFLIQFDVEAK